MAETPNKGNPLALGIVFVAFGIGALWWYYIHGPILVGIVVAAINFAGGGWCVYRTIRGKK